MYISIIPHIKKLAAYFAAVLCGFSSVLFASDKAALEALVAKGILTPSEAAELSKDCAAIAVSGTPTTKTLRLSSRFQLQGAWIESEMTEGVAPDDYGSRAQMLVRRMFLQADAGLGAGWDVRFSVDLARKYVSSVFTDTYLSKKIESEYLNGKFYMGYMKPGFSYEDMLSSFGLTAIERSAATMYWTGDANNRRLGIGNRYAGVFWRGDVKQLKGVSYALAITNSFQLSPCEIPQLSYNFIDNSLAYWASVHHEVKGETWSVKYGVYSMYSSCANHKMGIDSATSICSINPYVAGRWNSLYFWADYMASVVDDGARDSIGKYTQTSSPYGANFSVEYRFDIGDFGQIAPTFRYSFVDTDRRGIRISDAQRNVDNVGSLFNYAQDFYVGVNWYLNGDNLKIQLGYTYVMYWGEASDRSADYRAESDSVRVQFQIKL